MTWQLQLVFVALSLIGAGFGFFCATRCARDRDAVDAHVRKLVLMRAVVIDLERSQQALATSIRSINGKLAHLRGESDSVLPARMGAPPSRDTEEPGVTIERPDPNACENWLTAQREGPYSDAARCECSYCVTKRMERAKLRRDLLPARGAEEHAAQVRDHKARA